jgi:hypothetical protein
MLACLILTACAGVNTPLPPLPPATRVRASPTAAMVVAVVGGTFAPAATATPVGTPQALGLGQHLSASGSYTQTETEAAGLMLCQIERDSCAYSRMVIDRNPAILFSEGEPAPFGREDRMMHPDLVLPLARLAERVTAEWGESVQLMVTEAYDSLLDHDLTQPNLARRYSLHFEGRSLDLITWPPDEGRNGRLCVLALEAGFDWVHNEGDHCHVSLNANSLCSVCSPSAGQ